ncbi:MAG: hypothetical protein ACI865_001773 [Flavobacteriaceae bacterium]|jgi:hypothetical protein
MSTQLPIHYTKKLIQGPFSDLLTHNWSDSHAAKIER